MNNTQTLVLDAQQMEQKLTVWHGSYMNRIIMKNIIIAGIAKRGYVLAERIANILQRSQTFK